MRKLLFITKYGNILIYNNKIKEILNLGIIFKNTNNRPLH